MPNFQQNLNSLMQPLLIPWEPLFHPINSNPKLYPPISRTRANSHKLPLETYYNPLRAVLDISL